LSIEIKNQSDTSRLLFDELLDLSDDLIFLLSPEGNFVKINKLGSLNLEYDPDELEGKHFFSIIERENYSVSTDNFSQLLSGSTVVNYDAVLISRLGTNISYNITLKAINDDNKLIGVAGIARNTSFKIRAQSRIAELESRIMEINRLLAIERARWKQDRSILEELNKLKGEFISNISHELRTPLASIIGFSETILSDPEMSAELREEFNNIILTEGKRLAKLINEILEISRMESGKVMLVKNNLELKSALKEAVDLNLAAIKRKDLNFTFEFPDEEVIIRGDREKLLAAFDGIINNAVKFTNPGGRIKLLLHKMNKEAEIVISDTGTGIPEEDQPNIFKKLHTLSDSNPGISNVGMSLVFIKQIIDLHKGLILVHSEVNKGTTFVIKLPYENKSEGTP
jgi:PAS domain S-box-containing protein